MKAPVLDAEARAALLQDVAKPSPGPLEILVEVKAISLNPIDPLYVARPLGSSGMIVNSDFAGIVSATGQEVSSSGGLPLGTLVAGFLQGACSVNPRPGAFAKYLVVPWDLVWTVPDAVSLEIAAGVSLVALTAAQSIWYRLGMPGPLASGQHETGTPNYRSPWSGCRVVDTVDVLVYGASTSVGLYAAQMARLSTQASGNYDELVDYHDADWADQIKRLSDGAGMQYAYDAISEGASVEKVASLLEPDGRMAIVRSREGGAWEALSLPVEPIYGAVREGLGEEVQHQGFTIPKSLPARDFAVKFYQWLGGALGSEVQPVPVRLMPGGLSDVVEDGFALLGDGGMGDRVAGRKEGWMRPVSAEKLVYGI